MDEENPVFNGFPSPEPDPNIFLPISRKQFAFQLRNDGKITNDEALAWATVGTVPAPFNVVLDSIADEDVAFDARMHIAASIQFDRFHPMTSFIGYLLSTETDVYDEARINKVWRDASNL